MKKGFYSLVLASAVLGASSIAFAGAYGEAEQPEEIPAPVPAPPAPEPAPAKVYHKHVGFLTDSETTRGLRAEIGAFYGAEYHPSSVGDSEAVNAYLHISYGTELFEVGVFVPPYLYANQESIGEADDFGDMKLWGKVIPLRTERFSLGGGLVTTFPTGNDGFGTGEYGFLPFITGGALVGNLDKPVDLRLSFGYDVYTAHEVLGDDVYDRTDLNFAVLYPVSDTVVVRGEFTHHHLTEDEVGPFDRKRPNTDPCSLYPGVDVTFPLGSVDLVLRPTLGIGLHHAPDWQIGLGIAFEAPSLGM